MFQKISQKIPENLSPAGDCLSIQQKILLRVPDLSGAKSPAEGQIKKIIACLKSIASPRCFKKWKPGSLGGKILEKTLEDIMNGIQGLSHLGDSNILGVFVQLFCGKKILGGELTSLQNYFLELKNRVCCASNLLIFCELPAASLGSSEVFHPVS